MAERIREWREKQGHQIAKARGKRIAQACEWIVKSTKAITLSAAQIDLAERRTISQCRMKHFGPAALKAGNEKMWAEQMATTKAALYANQELEEPAAEAA